MNNECIANAIYRFTVTQVNLNIPIEEFKEKISLLQPAGHKWMEYRKSLYVLIGKESSDFRINEKGTYKTDMSSLISEHVQSFHMVGWH